MRRLQDIDLKSLRVFKAIVEAGGLAGAQAVLNSSQSTLSTQLADLEKRLGFRLCRRGRGGFALTQQGQRLLEALEDYLAAADHFQNAAASILGEMRGVLRLGVMDALLSNTAWDLPGILGDFHARARNTVIELSLLSPLEMERQLREGRRDLVIGPFFRQISGLRHVPLFQERHALYCATGHPLAGQDSVPSGALGQHPFVARGYLHRYDVARVGHVEPAALVDMMEPQALLIRSGRFIGYLPCHYAEAIGDLSRIRTATPTDYLSPIHLVHVAGADENILIRSFLNRLAEYPLRLPAQDGRDFIEPFPGGKYI